MSESRDFAADLHNRMPYLKGQEDGLAGAPYREYYFDFTRELYEEGYRDGYLERVESQVA